MNIPKKYNYHGEQLPINEIVRRSGLSVSTVRRKIKNREPIDDNPKQSLADLKKREVLRRYGYKV